MRIVILGCAGSGKTTLAHRLGERTGAPVICLDEIWQPHWDEKDLPAFRGLLVQAHAGDCWISDGNFAQATFDIRLPRATLIIWLERSRQFCIWHAMTRVFPPVADHRAAHLGKVLRFIWNFDRINRPRIEALRMCHAPNLPVRRIAADRELTDFLSQYENQAGDRTAELT
jgi:adenylate kinase family enzyme